MSIKSVHKHNVAIIAVWPGDEKVEVNHSSTVWLGEVEGKPCDRLKGAWY
jgi:hypothetical protein